MAIKNYVQFGTVKSSDFSVYVSGAKTLRSAEHDYERIEIPGRNGYLLQNNKRWKPVTIEYDAFTVSNPESNYKALVNAWGAIEGTSNITSTFDPEHFRVGYFDTNLDPVVRFMTTAQTTFRFVCQPERFLYDGQGMTTFTANGSIVNPTGFPAKPRIRVYGTGEVTIGGYSFTVTENATSIIVDCDMGDAYERVGGVLEYRNDKVIFTNYELPILGKGTTGVTLGTGITKVEITPRWWEL